MEHFFDKIFANQKFDISSLDYSGFESQVSFIEKLSQVQNSSVIIYDVFKKEYIYVHLDYAEELGYNPKKGEELGLEYYISLVHPEDFKFVLDTYKKAFSYINELSIREKKDYKLIYSYRTKGKEGKYYSVIDQMVVLELDKKGNVWLLMTISDKLPSNFKFKKANRQLLNTKNNKLYLFEDSIKFKEKAILSAREIEVLGLVSKGYASKIIADKLFLSVHTVNNHRKKILEKIDASNIAEAITYAKNLGFI